MATLSYVEKKIFHELGGLEHDSKVTEAVSACIDTHKMDLPELLEKHYKTEPAAKQKVSAEELQRILGVRADIHGIATNREISNCIVFNAPHISDSVQSERILQSRKKLDKVVSLRMEKLFFKGEDLTVNGSGHFLYPPGGYMGWHTNSQSPGWRLYINYAEEPGKSFFRYRDPKTGASVTLWDKQWNFRLFRIDPNVPFWHAVYSNTYRYSFGFRITRPAKSAFRHRVARKIKKVISGFRYQTVNS